MRKDIIQLSKIARGILNNKKSKLLNENASGLASTVQSQVVGLGKELKAAGEDVTDQEVQAALLMAALKNNGKLDGIDTNDIEAITNQIKEARSYRLKESGGAGGGLLHTLEMVGAIMGNEALLNVVVKTMKDLTGKEVNPDKISQAINKFTTSLKKVTGLPAKAMEAFFAWITKKLGGGKASQKIAGYSGTMIIIAVLFALGLAFFPVLGATPIMVFLSISGLVGKGFELAELWSHLSHAIAEYKKEGGEGAEELPNLQPA